MDNHEVVAAEEGAETDVAEVDVDKWVVVPDVEAEVDQGVEKEGQGPEDHQVTEACLEAEGKVTSVINVLTITYSKTYFFFQPVYDPTKKKSQI